MTNNNQIPWIWDSVGIDLQNISQEKLQDVIHDYYQTSETVKNIIKKYNLNVNASTLIRNFPKIMTSEKCPYDQANMIKNAPSRTIINSSHDENAFCPKCSHENNAKWCKCDGCLKKQEEERQKKEQFEEKLRNNFRKIVIERFISWNHSEKIKSQDLSLTQRLFIAAILSSMMDENLSKILPYEKKGLQLTPGGYEDLNLLENFFNKGILTVDAVGSDLNAFELDKEDGQITFYLNKVTYNLNIDVNGTASKDKYAQLRRPDRAIFAQDIDATFDLCRKVAVLECLAYLNHYLTEFKIPTAKLGAKTMENFNNILDEYPISQACNLIYMSVSSANSYRTRKDLSNTYTRNVAIHNLDYYATKAKNNNWQLHDYIPTNNIGIDAASSILFDDILKIGSRGWTEVLSKEFLRENLAK